MTRCTDIPISWLRLEQLALGEHEDRQARDHAAACEACRAALASIENDRRRLRPLGLTPRRSRRRLGLGLGLAAAAAAAAAILFAGRGPDIEERGAARLAIKGGGELIVGLVRERGGAIDTEPESFAGGDRFKVAVTCTEPGLVALDVVVLQGGETFRPLGERPRIRCGNRALVPGAFRVTGSEPATVCVSAGEPYDASAAAACLTLRPSR